MPEYSSKRIREGNDFKKDYSYESSKRTRLQNRVSIIYVGMQMKTFWLFAGFQRGKILKFSTNQTKVFEKSDF